MGSLGVVLSAFLVFPPDIVVLGFVGAASPSGGDVGVVVSEPFLSGRFSKGKEASAVAGC